MPRFQPDFFLLAEPLHQEAQRGDRVASFQQSRDNLRVGLGTVELSDMVSPELNITGRFTRRTPFRQHLSDM